MKSLLCVMALAFALSPAFRQTPKVAQAAPPPQSKSCDEATKKALYQRFYKNYAGDRDRQNEAHEAAKEYLCRCADDEEVSLFVNNWRRKWEHATGADAQAPAAAADYAKPRCRCDEMREELSKLTGERMGGYAAEHGKKVYEASKKFLRVCGGEGERFEAFVRSWVEKYDRAVREFEERRKAEQAAPKDPTKEQ